MLAHRAPSGARSTVMCSPTWTGNLPPLSALVRLRVEVSNVVVGLAGVAVVRHVVIPQSKIVVVDGPEVVEAGRVAVDDFANTVEPQAARIDAVVAASTHATQRRGLTGKNASPGAPSREWGQGESGEGGRATGTPGCATRFPRGPRGAENSGGSANEPRAGIGAAENYSTALMIK
jgi:hypothetical protein